MYVCRREDGSIYGCWTVRQWEGQEELPLDHPEVVAFFNPPPPTQAELEERCRLIFDTDKLFRAKCISDLAFRLGKLPGLLTGAELIAERNRIAAIYRAL